MAHTTRGLLYCFLMGVVLLVGTGRADTINVPADVSTIQGAINSATHGDTVIVAPGTYIENLQFNGKNIVLRSTDPLDSAVVAGTIIDGGSSGSVITLDGTETSDCVISGLTITNGKNNRGGGILAGNFGFPSIQANAKIEYNRIHNNSALGIVSSAEGGGIAYCGGIIRNNEIFNNISMGGGGIASSDGVIKNNKIFNNHALMLGGALFNCNDGFIQNNIIYNNTVESGSGGGLASCNAIYIYNNTIYGNTVIDGEGGGVLCSAPLVNCIVWGNSATESDQIRGSCNPGVPEPPLPHYSCIQDWTGGGVGNISDDPLFADAANGDFHLTLSSPCIDSGSDGVSLTEDFEGSMRPLGDGFDIGAYEFDSPTGFSNWNELR